MPPGSMVGSWSVVAPRSISDSMSLQLQGSIATKGQADIPGLHCLIQGAGCCVRAVQNWPHLSAGHQGELTLGLGEEEG